MVVRVCVMCGVGHSTHATVHTGKRAGGGVVVRVCVMCGVGHRPAAAVAERHGGVDVALGADNAAPNAAATAAGLVQEALALQVLQSALLPLLPLPCVLCML